jgi:hypothetical protein
MNMRARQPLSTAEGKISARDFIVPFEDRGFYSGISLYPPAEAAIIAAEFEVICAVHDRASLQFGYLLHDRHFHSQVLWNLATNSLLLEYVQTIIGSDILLLGSRFVCKWPNDNALVPWHQDSAENGLELHRQVVVWFAVDDTTEDNGCVRVIPHSHRMAAFRHDASSFKSDEWLVPRQLTGMSLASSDGTALVLRRGEAALFDGRIVHGSARNSSALRRCGYILRYVPTLTKPVPPQQWAAILVHGVDVYGHFGRLTYEAAKNFAFPMKKARGQAEGV